MLASVALPFALLAVLLVCTAWVAWAFGRRSILVRLGALIDQALAIKRRARAELEDAPPGTALVVTLVDEIDNAHERAVILSEALVSCRHGEGFVYLDNLPAHVDPTWIPPTSRRARDSGPSTFERHFMTSTPTTGLALRPHHYQSKEVRCWAEPGAFVLRSDVGEIVVPSRVNPVELAAKGHPAIMLELSEEQRLALGLPACEAVTGGTALCLAHVDRLATGEVEEPTAPTDFGKLMAAELWPLHYVGLVMEGATVDVRPIAKGQA